MIIMNKNLVGVMLIVLVGAIAAVWLYPPVPIIDDKEVKEAGTFDECVKEGNPVQESYPPVCRSKSGKTITQNIGNELVLRDKIRIDTPRPVEKVKSPLKITGEARGTWFFEGQFSANLIDKDGQILGSGIMSADGEWMTEEFAPYSGEIEFTTPKGADGKLVLEKSNPSGIPEKDSQLIVPVKF